MTDSRHATSAGAIFRRVYELLDGREKRIAGGLMAAVFANSFVDLLGLAAVIPVIGLVVEPELISSNAFLGSIYDIAYANGIGSEKRFLTLLCFLLIAAFLFKTLFGIWLNHVQSRFAFRVAHRMSGEVWLHHFSDSLERMRSKESGRVLTEINSWPVLFARVFITGGQLLINELVVMVLLAIGLTAYDPLIFLGCCRHHWLRRLAHSAHHQTPASTQQRNHSAPRSHVFFAGAKCGARISGTHHIPSGSIGPTQLPLPHP